MGHGVYRDVRWNHIFRRRDVTRDAGSAAREVPVTMLARDKLKEKWEERTANKERAEKAVVMKAYLAKHEEKAKEGQTKTEDMMVKDKAKDEATEIDKEEEKQMKKEG